MTTGNEKAMRLALEALESCTPEDTSTSHVIYAWHDEELVNKAIKALEEVLAKQSDSVEQSVSVGEPVGYFNANIDGKWEQSESNDGVPFFAATPQQRIAERKPLTDDHPLMVFARECVLGAYPESELADAAIEAIEAAHGIKE